MNENEQQIIAYLRTPIAIRQRCDRLFNLCCEDKLQYFSCDLTQLERVADYVIAVIQENYPDLNIPFHSRWRHFEVGGVNRLAELNQAISGLTPLEKAQIKFDLAIISVLLDAGAGSAWQYHERETRQVFNRSEGLAVASFRMFCSGAFSSNPKQPLQADAIALSNLKLETLAQVFQVRQTNPLVGLEGRLELLQRLGQVLTQNSTFFGTQNPRPGNLVNYLVARERRDKDDKEDKVDIENSPVTSQQSPVNSQQSTVNSHQSTVTSHESSPTIKAATVLTALLEGLGEIWPGRNAIAGVNLGDVWIHSALKGDNLSDSYVPFHKLSQWLTYSLLEPLQELGCEITGLDELTGLPEYRNGGLLVDLGILQAKHPSVLKERHSVSSEVIVEWRALTVILLDKIAAAIRQKLNLNTDELPLVKILQGGTWTAGRKIAAELRQNAVAPIQIESDGTVF